LFDSFLFNRNNTTNTYINNVVQNTRFTENMFYSFMKDYDKDYMPYEVGEGVKVYMNKIISDKWFILSKDVILNSGMKTTFEIGAFKNVIE